MPKQIRRETKRVLACIIRLSKSRYSQASWKDYRQTPTIAIGCTHVKQDPRPTRQKLRIDGPVVIEGCVDTALNHSRWSWADSQGVFRALPEQSVGNNDQRGDNGEHGAGTRRTGEKKNWKDRFLKSGTEHIKVRAPTAAAIASGAIAWRLPGRKYDKSGPIWNGAGKRPNIG